MIGQRPSRSRSPGRWVAGIGVTVAMAGIGLTVGHRADGSGGAGLTAQQRVVVETVVDILEHDTPVPQYGFLDDRRDGRGFAAGRASFSTAGGELVSVVEDYAAAQRDTVLAGYLPAL